MKICPECLERVDDDLEECPTDGTDLREIHARDDDPLEGRIFDETWLLESKVGGGGMGRVYRAHQLTVDRPAAVKVLRSDLGRDDEHVQRFFREANVASKINDPRCVTIYDFGQTPDDHILYLAMEYLEGESLHERLDGEPLTLVETLRVGIQIADALETLHSQGIVHRDLKPENVFLIDDLEAEVSLKLLDFGLAKVARSEGTPVTATGQVFGTPEFMSPEQCTGAEIGPASDLYALGCLLYELVSGRTPFEGSSAVEILLAHVNRSVPRLDGRAAVPVEYTDLILELLEKEPAERPGSARAVRERLEGILDSLDCGDPPGGPAAEWVEVQGASPRDVAVSETLGADSDVEPTPKMDADQLRSDREAPFPDTSSGSGERGGRLPWIVAGVFALLGVAYAAGLFETSPSDAVAGRELAETPRMAASGGSRAEAAVDAGDGRERRDTREHAREDTSPSSSDRQTEGDAAARTRPERRDADRTASATETSGESETRSQGAETEEELEHAPPVLTEATADRLFQSKDAAVRRCFLEGLGPDAGSGGLVELEVVVDASGDVERASITESTVGSESIRECVRKLAADWSFPPTVSGRPAKLRHQYGFEWKNLK